MSNNCKHNTCDGELCRRPVKPGIKKVSDKMRVQQMIYSPIAKKFREDNPVCQLHGPECTGKTDGVHHMKGRIGALLTDVRYFMASCWPCNQHLEQADGWAREHSFKISKFRKEE